jgi:hypothetical protein
MMIGGVAQQSPMRLHNQLLSRSDGCSQGRREPTRSAREPLTASPSAGYPCARHLTQLLKPDTLDPSGCQRKSQVLQRITQQHTFFSCSNQRTLPNRYWRVR